MGSDDKDRASELKILQATDSQFWNVVDYKAYCLLDKAQTDNEVIAVSTSKCAKRMETLMNVYEFDDKPPIAVLCFMTRLKRACHSNRVLKVQH